MAKLEGIVGSQARGVRYIKIKRVVMSNMDMYYVAVIQHENDIFRLASVFFELEYLGSF